MPARPTEAPQPLPIPQLPSQVGLMPVRPMGASCCYPTVLLPPRIRHTHGIGSLSTPIHARRPQQDPKLTSFMQLDAGPRSVSLRAPQSGPSSARANGTPRLAVNRPMSLAPNLVAARPSDRCLGPLGRPRVCLQLRGRLLAMAYNWSTEELKRGRRLVKFWRKQEGRTVHAAFCPIEPKEYVKRSIVVSCMYREATDECYITSIDVALLLGALVSSRLSLADKQRIRRDLQTFQPETLHISPPNSEEFYDRIRRFDNPKVRKHSKRVTILPWKVLDQALFKVLDKFVADVRATSFPEPNLHPTYIQNGMVLPSPASTLPPAPSALPPFAPFAP